jgi:hypothetical protein
MRVLEHRFAHISQEARRGRAWLAGLQPLYDGVLPAAAIVPEDALLSYHHLGAIILAVERGPARIVARTPQRVVAQMLDHVVLRAHSGGPVQFEAANYADRADDGALVLFDLAEPVRLLMPAGTSVAVVLPRRRLVDVFADGGVPRGRILDGGREPLVRLLSGHLRDLAGTLGMATPLQLAELVPATLALCRIAVATAAGHDRNQESDGGSVASWDGPDPLALAVRHYIEAHMATVDVSALRARFGLSRSALYQLSPAPPRSRPARTHRAGSRPSAEARTPRPRVLFRSTGVQPGLPAAVRHLTDAGRAAAGADHGRIVRACLTRLVARPVGATATDSSRWQGTRSQDRQGRLPDRFGRFQAVGGAAACGWVGWI